MLGFLAPMLNGCGGGELAATDVALLREIEQLRPDGPLASTGLITADGRPSVAWDPERDPLLLSRSAQATSAPPAARRAGDAILDELRRYFERQRGVRVPNARTVLGGQLARWAMELRELKPALDAVRWWCDFLCRLEDARIFTRSNWASASTFEETLSRCRLILLNLRCRLEDNTAALSLEGLQATLQETYWVGRDVADRILELLYMALRPRPAVDRCCFHELERQAELHDVSDAFMSLEDQLIRHILEVERLQAVDALAPALLRAAGAVEAGVDCVPTQPSQPVAPSTELLPQEALSAMRVAEAAVDQLCSALARGDGPPTTRITPSLVRAVGRVGLAVFLELHGLYCLLSALLQRLELFLRTVREYARFVCFLPLHSAAIFDLGTVLPELGRRVADAVSALSIAYESMPREAAPRSRGVLLEKCRYLMQQLEHCDGASSSALAVLKACTPRSTLGDFEGWRTGDKRWLQVARVYFAARELLPATEIVEITQLATNLQRGGCGRASFCMRSLADAEAATNDAQRGTVTAKTEVEKGSVAETEAEGGVLGRLGRIGVRSIADEDTRLYEAGRNVGLVGQRLCEAAGPTVGRVSQFVRERLPSLRTRQGAIPSELVTGFLRPSRPPSQRGCFPESTEWVMIEDLEAEVNFEAEAEIVLVPLVAAAAA